MWTSLMSSSGLQVVERELKKLLTIERWKQINILVTLAKQKRTRLRGAAAAFQRGGLTGSPEKMSDTNRQAAGKSIRLICYS